MDPKKYLRTWWSSDSLKVENKVEDTKDMQLLKDQYQRILQKETVVKIQPCHTRLGQERSPCNQSVIYHIYIYIYKYIFTGIQHVHDFCQLINDGSKSLSKGFQLGIKRVSCIGIAEGGSGRLKSHAKTQVSASWRVCLDNHVYVYGCVRSKSDQEQCKIAKI